MGSGKAILIVLAAIVAAGAYWLTFRPHAYRYEMKIDVYTPEGVRSGSAVREVKWFPQPKYLAANRFSFSQRGEAVAVDLPNGQTLFSLLDRNGYETILAGFGPAPASDIKAVLDRADSDRQIQTYPSRDALLIRRLSLPTFVRFRDPNDPESVEIVDPDNLGASFGPDVKLERITVQMTDKPVTESIESRLRWLPDLLKRRARLNGRTGSIANTDLANTLGSGRFKAGR